MTTPKKKREDPRTGYRHPDGDDARRTAGRTRQARAARDRARRRRAESVQGGVLAVVCWACGNPLKLSTAGMCMRCGADPKAVEGAGPGADDRE